MKKWWMICLLLVSVLFGAYSEAEANAFREVKVTGLSTMTLKKEPNSEADTLAYLPQGTFVTQYMVTEDGWAYVKAYEQEGYMVAQYLQNVDSVIKIASSKSGLVVKESPDPEARTLAVLTYNMIVEDFGPVTERSSYVQYGNVAGYVVSTFIGKPATTTKFVGKDELMVRNIASPSGAAKGYLAKDTQVEVHATLLGWAYVTAGELRGYVEAARLVNKEGYITADYFKFANFKTLSYTSTSGSVLYRLNGQQIQHTANAGYTLRLDGNTFILDNFGSPEIQLPLPVQHGQKWKSGNESYSVRVLNTYKVRAGTFKNVLEVTMAAYGMSTKYYFAPQTGVIKISVEAYNFELSKINR